MRCLPRQPARRGTSAVEAAFVFPIAFFMVIGLIVGGYGVFLYNQLQNLTREGSRWASVHGYDAYHAGVAHAIPDPTYGIAPPDNQTTAKNNVLTYSVLPRAVSFNNTVLTNNTTVTVDDPKGYWGQWYYDTVTNTWKPNRVTIAINYPWQPPAYWGTITFRSTSALQISY